MTGDEFVKEVANRNNLSLDELNEVAGGVNEKQVVAEISVAVC